MNRVKTLRRIAENLSDQEVDFVVKTTTTVLNSLKKKAITQKEYREAYQAIGQEIQIPNELMKDEPIATVEDVIKIRSRIETQKVLAKIAGQETFSKGMVVLCRRGDLWFEVNVLNLHNDGTFSVKFHIKEKPIKVDPRWGVSTIINYYGGYKGE